MKSSLPAKPSSGRTSHLKSLATSTPVGTPKKKARKQSRIGRASLTPIAPLIPPKQQSLSAVLCVVIYLKLLLAMRKRLFRSATRTRKKSLRVRPPRAPSPLTTSCCPKWSDRKSTRLNSSHVRISYAVFCLKKKNKKTKKQIH